MFRAVRRLSSVVSTLSAGSSLSSLAVTAVSASAPSVGSRSLSSAVGAASTPSAGGSRSSLTAAAATSVGAPRRDEYDVCVVGGGHNALVAAAYLARAGKRVVLLERRPVLGGAAVTEEIVPGFLFSRASYVYALFRPAIVDDLELRRHGLVLLRRSPSSFTPTPRAGGPSLVLGAGDAEDEAEIARHSAADARAWRAYNAQLDVFANALRPLLDVAPPDVAELCSPPVASGHRSRAWRRYWANARDALTWALALARLGPQLPLFFEALTAPASKLLDRWFESRLLKATLATDAVIGAMVAPSTPGSAYVLLHHVMCGTWYNVRGGMGALSAAIARSAVEAGAELVTSAAVSRVLVERGAAVGVALEDGREVRARAVLSTAAPTLTLGPLLGGAAAERALLPDAARAALRSTSAASGSVKINLALSALPNFICKPNPVGMESAPQAWHRGTIHFEDDPEMLEAAYRDAAAGRASARPIIEMTLPSVLDDSLAPPGRHVCLLFVQYAPYEAGWDAPGAREAFAARVYAVIEEHAPGFTASILGADILTPPDLERVFGLPRGNIFHAAMSLDQLAWLRPFAGGARYATPVPGLYVGGAGTHPGGGVMGAAGANAARAILLDGFTDDAK